MKKHGMNRFSIKKVLVTTLVCSMSLLWPLSNAAHAQRSQGGVFLSDKTWDELSPKERSRALENYQRFQKLPPDKKRLLEERYDRWQRLPAEERDRIKKNYRRYRSMDSDEKEDFLRKYRNWRSHPKK